VSVEARVSAIAAAAGLSGNAVCAVSAGSAASSCCHNDAAPLPFATFVWRRRSGRAAALGAGEPALDDAASASIIRADGPASAATRDDGATSCSLLLLLVAGAFGVAFVVAATGIPNRSNWAAFSVA